MKKKKFAVYARTKNIVHEGLHTGRGHREFRANKSLMNISDPSEAQEIDDKYGMKGSQDVYVVEDDRYAHAVNGEKWEVRDGSRVETLHHYTFGQMGLDLPRREDVIGKRKVINGTTFEYVLRGDKIRLESIPLETRKTRRRSAEVSNAVPKQKTKNLDGDKQAKALQEVEGEVRRKNSPKEEAQRQ